MSASFESFWQSARRRNAGLLAAEKIQMTPAALREICEQAWKHGWESRLPKVPDPPPFWDPFFGNKLG